MSLYLLFFMLLCSSAFFSSSETAYFSLSKHRRFQLAQDPRKSAQLVAKLRANPKSLLVTVLFGNELTNIAISIVSASILSEWFPSLTLAEQALLSASFVVPTLLIFGEITPKTIAAIINERVALAYVFPLSFFSWLITPARWTLLQVAELFTKRFTQGDAHGQENLNEESFRALVDAGTREGVLEQEESELIHNAFQFTDQKVAEVMIEWSKVFTIHDTQAISEAISEVSQHAFSRIPIWNDQDKKVIGILYAKDLLVYRWGERTVNINQNSTPLSPHSIPLINHEDTPYEKAKRQTVKSIAHRVVFTTKETSLGQLLETFKRKKKHMAIVLEENGNQPIGICTLEDVLEVIFGPIHEESLSDGELTAEDLFNQIGEKA